MIKLGAEFRGWRMVSADQLCISPVSVAVYRRTQDVVLRNRLPLGIPYVSRLVLRKDTPRGIRSRVVFAGIKRVVVDVRNAASGNLCFFPLTLFQFDLMDCVDSPVTFTSPVLKPYADGCRMDFLK